MTESKKQKQIQQTQQTQQPPSTTTTTTTTTTAPSHPPPATADWMKIAQSVIRGVFFWFVVRQLFNGQVFGGLGGGTTISNTTLANSTTSSLLLPNPTALAPASTVDLPISIPTALPRSTPAVAIPGPYSPAWSKYDLIDVFVYVTDNATWSANDLYTVPTVLDDDASTTNTATADNPTDDARTMPTTTTSRLAHLLRTHLIWQRTRFSLAEDALAQSRSSSSSLSSSSPSTSSSSLIALVLPFTLPPLFANMSESVASGSRFNLTEPFLTLAHANHSLYAHIYLARHGYPHCEALAQLLNTSAANAVTDEHSEVASRTIASLQAASMPVPTNKFVTRYAQAITHSLTRFKTPPKVSKRRNLLSSSSSSSSSVGFESNMDTNMIGDASTAATDGDDIVDTDDADDLLDDNKSDFSLVDSSADASSTSSSATSTLTALTRRFTTSTHRPPVLHWRPTLAIRVLDDFQVYHSRSSFPPENAYDYRLVPSFSCYYPPLFVDMFWHLSSDDMVVNTTVSALPLRASIELSSSFTRRLKVSMERSWQIQSSFQMDDGRDHDILKRMLLETNPYLLLLTVIVSLLHSVFDFLAFKNDITFWRNNKSMVGLSARSIVLNTASQIIVFLYLCDNDTSWMILVSSGIGVLIEMWKVQKTLAFVRVPTFPYVRIDNKNAASEEDREPTEEERQLQLTQQYDREAMVYLSYVLYPCLAAYTAYSLVYESHKGWYSFVLSTLVGFVYMFGFITMCPQLYLNYKLKSVAHLPWRMLTYKALNTFIDDLFAFIITMPTLHRLSCFRDDVVFFIFLYQKWAYRVDYTRVNEFGVTGEDLLAHERAASEKEKQQQQLELQEEEHPAARNRLLPADSKSAMDEGKETITVTSSIGDSKETSQLRQRTVRSSTPSS